MGISSTFQTTAGPRTASQTQDLKDQALAMYLNSTQGLRIEAEVSRRACTRVTATLFSVAVLKVLSLILLTVVLARLENRSFANVLLFSEAISTAVMWALAIWSLRSPLGAAVASLAVFFTFWMAQNTLEYQFLVMLYGVDGAVPHLAPNRGTLIRLSVVVLLIQGIRAGIRHRQYTRAAEASQEQDLSPALQPRRLAGVTTAILLYLLYLYLPLNLAVLQIDGDLDQSLMLRHLLGWGIIIGVWSIASWRDTYRPLLRPAHWGWYLGAVGLGGFTYLFASTLMQWFTHAMKLPVPPAEAVSAAGSGLLASLLIMAVYPAVFEEIAFRGVIYTGLTRWLTAKEAILASSLMFMAIHMNPVAFPHLLVMGIILGVLRWKSGTWLPGVILHFVHNALCIVVPMMSAGR